MEDKRNIGQLFDAIAGSYDKLNHLLSLSIDKRWRRKAAGCLAHKSEHLLDVAIGTADLSIEILRQHKAEHITGIDLSEQMMAIGKRKAGERPIDFLKVSALDMPFEDESFDAVTCGFGVRNFSNLDKGLKEMYRVLKTGGELVILEFSYPQNKFVAWVYDLYFSHILPLIGGALSNNRKAYRYLNTSVKNFVWGEQMASRLRTAGFDKVQIMPLTLGIATVYKTTK